jgi:hypothetical protein
MTAVAASRIRVSNTRAGLSVLVPAINVSVNVPSAWHVRDKIVNNLTEPVPLFFGSTDDLPLVDTVQGDEDIAVEDLENNGIAVAIVAYDLRRSASSWLAPAAVAALKNAGEWPYDAAANVGFDLARPFGLADLAEISADQGRRRLVGWFKHGTWCVGIEVWLGSGADFEVAQAVVTSIRPA